ncbi:DUF6916 family protein [Nocardioides bizhenqiangii]|uniref:DUF6916 domain-containing protein n=1 Tax=Nocardioides bizhenqiangii TaxID=3095076 RepID=A0ABZ0ZV91_9ACTN|nr:MULTISPECIES: hypothetical protein [unclassified Nocardioides]MDZ5623248.1 hypothetical protein [Nocardioides sp. HM23]WQQ28220.1 hypothetical protein SHK19_08290 [Nocardioides sp. HM61]
MAETAWFTYDDFADRVGDEFRVRVPDADHLTLVLSEVTAGAEPSGTGPDGAERQQFSLIFRSPSGHQLSQGTWELEHDRMGELALFLVPIEPDADGPRFEAAFA